MLSEQELRRLNEIERELTSTDPRLAASLSTMCLRQRWAVSLAVLGWATFAAIAATDWWRIAVLMFGPLIPITLLALANLRADTAEKSGPPPDPQG